MQRLTVQSYGFCHSAPYFYSVQEVKRHNCSTDVREGGVECRAAATLVGLPCSNWRAGCSTTAPAFLFLQELHQRSEPINFFFPTWQEGRKRCCQPFQECSHSSDTPIMWTFKALAIWQLLSNIIKFIIPEFCITSKSDIYLFSCPEVKPIYAKWGNGNCFIDFALIYTVYTPCPPRRKSATCSPDLGFSTYLAISIEKKAYLSLCSCHIYHTMALYKKQLCIRKTYIQD